MNDPAYINNSREIIRQKVELFKKYPSEKLAQEIESMSGLTADHSDADYGEGPKQ